MTDRGFVVRAIAGAAAIGIVVALLGAAVWLVARDGAGSRSSPSPAAIASASTPAPGGSLSGTPVPSAVASSPSPPSSSSPTTSGSGAPAPALEPPTSLGSAAVVSAVVSPFADCTAGGAGSVATNTEVEPTVGVDPTRPATIVAAWQQDRWSNGAARGIVAGASTDGGRAWTRQSLPVSSCAKGGAGLPSRATDPWLSFGPDGTAYLATLATDQPNVTRVAVSTSADGGATWAAAVQVLRSDSARQFNDKESVTADPTRTGRAYVVWDQNPGGESESSGQPAAEGSVLLAITTDRGRTWSSPRTIASLRGTPVGNEIAVLPDGSLVDVFVLVPRTRDARASMLAIRSTDGGGDWSDPVTIATLAGRNVIGAQPPGVRGGGGLPDVAVDRATGRLLVVWIDSEGDAPDIVLTSSTDGRRWAAPTTVPRPSDAAAFLPSIETTAAGEIGIEYTDLRAATGAQQFLADRFLTVSSDGGATWRERRLTSTFDLATAPDAGGRFLGDYSGLATAGEEFVSTFAITTGDADNPTDLVVRVDPADDPGARPVP